MAVQTTNTCGKMTYYLINYRDQDTFNEQMFIILIYVLSKYFPFFKKKLQS